jgi:SDR family mycofactocin-dependent oxidoreductase
MGILDGKVAFITGAARGQGRSHAVTFAKEGADIAALDICQTLSYPRYPLGTKEELDETVRLVENCGRRALGLEADIRNPAQMEIAVQKAIEKYGHIDILFCNAGVCDMANAWDFTEEMWDIMIDVNLKGAWLTTKYVVPHMLARGQGGRILITSSVAGLRPLRGLAHYCAAKWGVVGLAKVLALELAEANITVNTLHPMGVDTPMMDGIINIVGSREVLLDQFKLDIPMPVFILQPEDVTKAALWLVSDDAKHMTGVTFTIDGGQMLQ